MNDGPLLDAVPTAAWCVECGLFAALRLHRLLGEADATTRQWTTGHFVARTTAPPAETRVVPGIP
jgi:hypothetical protein